METAIDFLKDCFVRKNNCISAHYRAVCKMACKITAFLLLGSWFHLTNENTGLAAPHVQCKPLPYAQVGGIWQCICVSSEVSSEWVRVYWPRHSNSSILKVPSVTRQHNGTAFTCQMEYVEDNLPKTAKTVVYLEVAYGPENGSVRIYGIDVPFDTDGTRNLTLTCNASDTNPKPSIVWLSGPCESRTEETCIFQPQPDDDGSTMNCRAINVHTQPKYKWSEANSSLNLRYPPRDSPVLTGHKDQQIHKSGDILTCTVTGGKPVVTQVILNCSNPTLYDQADVVNGTSVSSSLTLDSSEQTYSQTTCQCTAIWEPDPALYSKSASATFAIIAQANEDMWKFVAIGILLPFLATIVCWVLLALWIFKTDLFPPAFTDALIKRLPKSHGLNIRSNEGVLERKDVSRPCVPIPNITMQENDESLPLLNGNRDSDNAGPDSVAGMLTTCHRHPLTQSVEESAQSSNGTVERQTEHAENNTIDDDTLKATSRQVDDMDARLDCGENALASNLKLVTQPDDKSENLILETVAPEAPDSKEIDLREIGAVQDSDRLQPKDTLAVPGQSNDDHETNGKTKSSSRGSPRDNPRVSASSNNSRF